MDEEFRARDGATLVEESKDRFRLAIFEMDGVAADLAGEAVDLHAGVADRLLAEGVTGVVAFVREGLERAIRAVASPEMGRQPASPLMEATLLCIKIAIGAASIAFIICAVWPYCWCCQTPLIAVGLAAAMGFCFYEEAIGWR